MCDCDRHQNNNGFTFGLLLGAIIGAIIAIYIYKNNKSDIFKKLKSKLEGYFKETSKEVPKKPSKISVTIPPKVESIDKAPIKSKKPAKLFKK